MKTEIFVAFVLIGFKCEPEEITETLGIVPTQTWKVGTPIGKRGIGRYEDNGWQVKSKLEKYADLESHIQSVLQQLEPAWESLAKISALYYTELSCHIYLYDDEQVPAIHFEQEVVRKIAELNAEIDVDIYVLPGD